MKEILYVNMECKIIYFSSEVAICKDDEEFSRIILQEKKRIEQRDYILNRFEHWEVDDVNSLRKLLVQRSRNNTEKNLVLKYIEHMNRS